MKRFYTLIVFFALTIIIAGSLNIFYVNAATITNATSSLQSQVDSYNQQIVTLNQQIANYQAQLKKIGSDKKTLQSAINTLDLQRKTLETQAEVTQRQIDATQIQIQQIGGEITDTENTIQREQAALVPYLRDLQKNDNKPLIIQLLSSNTITDAWNDLSANLQVQEGIQNKMKELQVQKDSLNNSKNNSQIKQAILTSQKQLLSSQQKSLLITEQAKSQLLAETKMQESAYQKLLAAAELQLKSFSAFVQNAGGSKLLGSQTVCDAWGCYYSQRDSAWGNDSLNGTKYTLASDGCLVTSMAMVMTHYGYRKVTPVTINSNPANFATYYPAYLLYTIEVDGVSATRKSASIDATLATGNPIIVGINAYGGTHFVVLVSGSNGNYIMRDPYLENGKDVSFTAHYSLRSIFSITKVVIN
jgi:peptidoglycan hydrolase CwlO-like protein